MARRRSWPTASRSRSPRARIRSPTTSGRAARSPSTRRSAPPALEPVMNVWVDCTAAAHPLVLRPIIERLRAEGHDVSVTARQYGQTTGILERLGIDHEVIGRHSDRGRGAKAAAVASRSAALIRWARPRRFDLALAHGSVDIAVVSSLLRIPLVEMQDYEYAGVQRQLAFRAARLVLAPDAIPAEAMRRAGAAPKKLFRYPGLKEDYYLFDFEPDSAVIDELGLDRDRVLAGGGPPPRSPPPPPPHPPPQ